ncbi:copper amine oxidase [Bisporella sp. PMI_857]|nr:copper amine oxidase [Bisporella sp. PMI_857]
MANASISRTLLISGLLVLTFWTFSAFHPYLSHAKLVLFSTPGTFSEISIHAPRKNVWADLTQDEVKAVREFMFTRTDLNLTRSRESFRFDNNIRLIEVLRPNKSDVLAYLNGNSAPPIRWARVVINDGVKEYPQVTNYMVGPLPIDNSTRIEPLIYCFNSDRNFVYNPMPTYPVLVEWVATFALNITDVLEELLDGTVDPLDPTSPENLGLATSFTSLEDHKLMLWLQFYRDDPYSEAATLLPQGLYVKVEISTKDTNNWKPSTCYYNRVVYDSVNELRKAMGKIHFEKTEINRPGDWSNTEDFDDRISSREKPPPLMIQPQGSRFLVDKEQKYVSYMGYEFYVTTAAATGMSLYDIRFHGDSVIYEVGLQEAMAHYAGDDPQQGALEFLDTTFMMGANLQELVPGYDCPAYATFLSATFSVGDSTVTKKNTICIFEYTGDHVLQRHSGMEHVTVSRNSYLIVRSVSTMENYDYTIDYIFYLDGTIEVKVRASGYIFAAFWANGQEDEYGYRIHDAIASSMHDHVLNFKADLDIVGTSNTLKRVGIEPTTKHYPWDDVKQRNTMHLVERLVETEAGIDWPKNAAEMLIVTNDNKTNAWGETRGYRIAPGTGIGNPSHLTILNSTTLGISAEWANRDLWVLKRKDTEPMSASALNYFDPKDPLVDFSKFIDGEDIVNEDLVIYFNLGSHHIPHSGDIPNTLMHTSASSIMFTPFNFNDRDPSRRSAQGVRVDRKGKAAIPRYFGATYNKGIQVPRDDLEPDLTQHHGSQANPAFGKTWHPGNPGF